MAIDDKLDAIKNQYPESHENLGLDLVIKVLTAIPGFPSLAAIIVDSMRTHFSTRTMIERFQALYGALEEMVRRFETRLEKIEERLNTKEFARAFVSVVNITILTPDLERVRKFGSILGYEAASGDEKGWDEAAALVIDLNRLTDADLVALEILVNHQGLLVQDTTTNSNYNDLAGAIPAILKDVDDRGIPRYEFYSRASRLSGFGLAMALNWNQSTWGPQDYGFAVTKRGKRLFDILQVT